MKTMLYLASASPRRRDLLTMLGLTFEICPAKIDETMDPSAPPAEEVERVARRKAPARPAKEKFAKASIA